MTTCRCPEKRLARAPQSRVAFRRMRTAVRLVAMLGIALLVVGPAASLFAQPAGSPGAPPLPGGNRPKPGGPRVPGQAKPGQTKPGQTKPGAPKTPVTEAPAQPVDKTKLPDGFVPQKPDHPAFTTDAEWVIEPLPDREARLQRTQFSGLLTSGTFASSEDEKTKQLKLISDVVRTRLAAFTLQENRETVQDLRVAFQKEIARNGRKADQGRQEVRQEVIAAVLKELPELMKYHFIARLNGVLLLAELNEYEADGTINQPAVPLTAAHDRLLEIVRDGQQLEAIRVPAVIGLRRILAEVPELKLAVRYKIVTELVKQLDASKQGGGEWFQYRLAEAVGYAGVLDNQDRQPVVIDALGRLLIDSDRPKLARVEAAYAFARLPLTNKVNVDKIAVEVARLAHEFGTQYQAESSSTVWNVVFFKLYAVFKPVEEAEAKRGWGLVSQTSAKAQLKAFKPRVDEVFGLVLPLIKSVAVKRDPKALEANLGKLSQWLATYPRDAKPFVEGGANMPVPKSVASAATAPASVGGASSGQPAAVNK